MSTAENTSYTVVASGRAREFLIKMRSEKHMHWDARRRHETSETLVCSPVRGLRETSSTKCIDYSAAAAAAAESAAVFSQLANTAHLPAMS